MKKIKLFCYPWSGGNGALFFKYSKLLGENFDIIPSDMDIDAVSYTHLTLPTNSRV